MRNFPQSSANPQQLHLQLKSIDLSDKDISHFSTGFAVPLLTSFCFRFTEIPPPVYKLKKLEILFINDNQVSTIDPAGLQRLGALATLDLQNNNISQVPPELGNCTSIKLVVQKFLSVFSSPSKHVAFVLALPS